MNKLKRNVKVFNIPGTIKIHFYQNNNMPALMVEGEDDNLIDNLTTNYREYIENTISIRSDEKDKLRLLLDAGWIKEDIIHSVSSGFININYFPLTDEAIKLVKEREKELEKIKEEGKNE